MLSHLTGQEPEEEVTLDKGKEKKKTTEHDPSQTIQRNIAAKSIGVTSAVPCSSSIKKELAI